MHPTLIDLGLRRAGYPSLERFMTQRGLETEAEATEALMPYILGYDLWRIRPGDTYTKIAREKDTSVQAIAAANPQFQPENLPIGAYLVVPFGFPVTPEDVPVTWQLTHYIIRGLQARYPFLIMDVIGRSAGGRPLERVQLGHGTRRVYFNGSHHANEWITTLVLLRCLEQYAHAVAFGENILGLDACALSRETVLYLVPLVNPDGVDLLGGMVTTEEQAAAEAIAADYPDIPFPAGWKANLRGVDLNLNYPALWDQAKELKYQQGFTGPAPRDFVGQCPLSELETQAMYDSTRALEPELVIAWHTQGQEIYWKFQDMAPDGARSLGRQMAIASGYQLEDVPYASGFAGYKDWFIQDFSLPGYTIEAGLGENPLPLSQMPDLLRDNLPIFLLGLSGGDPNFREPEEPSEDPEPDPPAIQARLQTRQLPGRSGGWG